MSLPVTALYAGLLAILFVGLSLRVIGGRHRAGLSLGEGDRALLRRIRAHANFAEYVPLALILLGLAEGLGTPRWILHGLGLGLLAGRLAHAWGVSGEPEDLRFRMAGMASTFTVIGLGAAACLVGFFLAT